MYCTLFLSQIKGRASSQNGAQLIKHGRNAVRLTIALAFVFALDAQTLAFAIGFAFDNGIIKNLFDWRINMRASRHWTMPLFTMWSKAKWMKSHFAVRTSVFCRKATIGTICANRRCFSVFNRTCTNGSATSVDTLLQEIIELFTTSRNLCWCGTAGISSFPPSWFRSSLLFLTNFCT